MNKSKMYKEKAEDSLILVTEFFNRPYETGRLSSVIIHLNHSIEMLLKSTLLRHDYDIRKDNGHTIDLSKCIRVLHGGTNDDPSLDFLSEDEKTTLNEIAGHRNEAMHGNTVISEQLLYAYTRSGLTIFESILSEEFDESLDDHLPNRVLPISGAPLKHLDIIYEEEKEKIQELLDQGARDAARAKARAIEISNRTQQGDDDDTPTDDELDDILDRIDTGDDFDNIFPGVSNLQFDVEGQGPTIKLKFTQSDGHPVHYVSDEEEAEEYAIGFREINPFDRYSMGIYDLADKIEEKYDGSKHITRAKVWAIVRKTDVHGNEEYHKELTTPHGGETDQYSHKAIDRVINALESGEVDPETAWETHGYN
jgi:hypothetical protein